MKLNAQVNFKMNGKEVNEAVLNATESALKRTITDIAAGAVKGSPILTGNNRRSIAFEAKGLESTAYSTSGYGGYLETGTVKMAARPYFKPALDANIGKLPGYIKEVLGK